MEKKRKVGRPKLADSSTKKKSIVMVIVCLFIVMVLVSAEFFTIYKTNYSKKVSGKLVAENYVLKASKSKKKSKKKKKKKKKTTTKAVITFTYDSKINKKFLNRFNKSAGKVNVIMYGTSIGRGNCTVLLSDGSCCNADKDYNCKDKKGARLYPFIEQVTDLYNMKLNNKAQSGCGGVYVLRGVRNNGYFKGSTFADGIMDLTQSEIKNYDFLIIEGFANDAENHAVKSKNNYEVFRTELAQSIQHLNKYKNESAIVMVVTTPKFRDGTDKKDVERQKDIWKAAKEVSKNNNAYYCNMYDVNAAYGKKTKDHPTYSGHANMALRMLECMVDAVDKY